jgi:hypothetical protein
MREGYGICPVCNGTKVRELTEQEKTYSWNKGQTHCACGNCGAQRMFGSATGEVRLNKDGNPCKHNYKSRTTGRCLTEYTCVDCGDRYEIDSSD